MATRVPSRHSTIFEDGRLPAAIREGSQHKCSICFKSGEYANIVAHMQTHEKSAVCHGGYKIYPCKGACARFHHYHCCYCPRMIARKKAFIAHVGQCKSDAPEMIASGSSSISTGAISLPKSEHRSAGRNSQLPKWNSPKIICLFRSADANPQNLKVNVERRHPSAGVDMATDRRQFVLAVGPTSLFSSVMSTDGQPANKMDASEAAAAAGEEEAEEDASWRQTSSTGKTGNSDVKNKKSARRRSPIGHLAKRPRLFTQQEITSLLLDVVVRDFLPLSAVQGDGFRQLLAYLAPGFAVPSAETLWRAIERRRDGLRDDLAEEMKGRHVSLTTDVWTSAADGGSYATVAAHYVTDAWERRRRVLRTCTWPEERADVNVARRLREVVTEWGVRVFCTVHGNAGNAELGETFPYDLGCSQRTLRRALRAALAVPDVAAAVEAARRLVGHFRDSPPAAAALARRRRRLGLSAGKLRSDCPLRWDSTFVMLRQLLEQRMTVQAVLADEALTDAGVRKWLALKVWQWELLERVVAVTEPLAGAAEAMRGRPHAGVSFVYSAVGDAMDGALRLDGSEPAAARTFKLELRRQLEIGFKLDSDELPESLAVTACLLDARFKRLRFLSDGQREAAHGRLLALLEDDDAPSVNDGEAVEHDCEFEQLFTAAEDDCGVRREVSDYLRAPPIAATQNPLLWWAGNQDRFPRLAKLAKRYLAVPATASAASSVAPRRAGLPPAHVDALVFLHANRLPKTTTALAAIGSEHDPNYDEACMPSLSC
ncbi:E3 SUMO-protein ligase ZBED1-like isoform X2 [Festucalex cinctus]